MAESSSELSVVLGTPHGGDVSPLWLDAFIGLEKPMHTDGSAAWRRVSVIRQEVAVARNLIAKTFLEDTNYTHLLFWDDDILPPPDGLIRLLEDSAPIVSGFYTTRMPPAQPVAYVRKSARKHQYQPIAPKGPGCFYADGVGAGFLLIAREVFERVPRPWFQFLCGRPRGENVSEDFWFCERAIKAGYKILVDAHVSCGHVGRYIYDDGDLAIPMATPMAFTGEAPSKAPSSAT